jgi:ethanolamine transporter
MAVIGIVVISLVMACAAAGAVASPIDDEKGLGKEFLEGLDAIGYIFVPVAGIMASIP